MAAGDRETCKVTSDTIPKHNQKSSKASTDHILTFKNIYNTDLTSVFTKTIVILASVDS